MWGFGLFGIYFFTSLYLQGVLGFSPPGRGRVHPMALLMAPARSWPRRSRTASERTARPAWPMFLMAAGIASVSLLGPHASYLALMPSFMLIGVGGGLSVPLTA